jgi:hypothetical protein
MSVITLNPAEIAAAALPGCEKTVVMISLRCGSSPRAA